MALPPRAAAAVGALQPLSDAEVTTLGEGGIVLRDDILTPQTVRRCRGEAHALLRQGDVLTPAGLGRSRAHRPTLRGDLTAFFTEAELPDHLARLWPLFEGLRLQLNASAWLGLQRFEVQLAAYPGDGARYIRHRDAFAGQPGRRVTAIIYLNPDWHPDDGGVLRAWAGAQQSEVEPRGGRLVLFRSDAVEHEVLPTSAPRFAVTAWYRGGEPVPVLPDPAVVLP